MHQLNLKGKGENLKGKGEKLKKTKTMAVMFALFLVFAIAVPLIDLPLSNAQTERELVTHIYVTAQPVGAVGQSMPIVYWTQQMPPDIGEQSGQVASPSGRAGWYDIKMVVTLPNGTEQTFDMPYSDPVGGGYLNYVPTESGNYSARAIFPGTWKNSTTSHTYYPPAESPEDPFVVREEPIASWPEAPLPDDYWMRPIPGPSHSWYILAGQWLGSYAQQYPQGASGGTTTPYGYGLAPESPHILWTRQHYPTGGIMDERFVDEVYTLNHYQDVDFDGVDLIVDGVIHYTPQYTGHWGAGIAAGSFGWGGISLYTGELLFLDDRAIKPDFGQIYLYNSPNQHGGFSYLWRTSNVDMPENVTREPFRSANETITDVHSRPGTGTWEMIDAWTRNRVAFVANVSESGTQVYGKDGSINIYNAVNLGTNANPDYYLQIWNSSEPITMYSEDERNWTLAMETAMGRTQQLCISLA